LGNEEGLLHGQFGSDHTQTRTGDVPPTRIDLLAYQDRAQPASALSEPGRRLTQGNVCVTQVNLWILMIFSLIMAD